MIKKLKIAGWVLLGLCFLSLSYQMGKLTQPKVSFESAYETVRDLNKNIIDSFNIKSAPGLAYSYIPAYSHIYVSEGEPLEMAITLSLRNVDMKGSIAIEQILYYNTEGKLIRKYLKESHQLDPLATKEIFIKKSDIEGGSGANFVVLFKSDATILPPIFEAIMTAESQGKSYVFNSRGVIYSDHGKN